MKTNIKNGILIFSIFLSVNVNAQNTARIDSITKVINSSSTKPLKKGDLVPDIILPKIINYKSKSAKISDFKNKLVILDFWAVDCIACIKSMPQVLALQERFKDQIQILLVTINNAKEINDLWTTLSKSSGGRSLVNSGKKLPFVIEDTSLAILFPHSGNPCHIWIDKNGVYQSTAYPQTTTISNIESFLKGEKANLGEQAESRIGLSADNPLLWINNPAFKASPKYYSFIFNYLYYYGSGTLNRLLKDSISHKVVGFNCINQSIVDLYKFAFFGFDKYFHVQNNRIIIEKKDSINFYLRKVDSTFYQWANQNLYCYALKVPVSRSDEVYNNMQQDLNSYFGLTGKIEKRTVKCLVLKRISSEDKLLTHGGPRIEKILEDTTDLEHRGISVTLQNAPFKDFISDFINEPWLTTRPEPFVNDVSYVNNIDIKWDISGMGKANYIDAFRNSLHKYGLDLVEEFRNTDMLVLKDNPDANHGNL